MLSHSGRWYDYRWPYVLRHPQLYVKSFDSKLRKPSSLLYHSTFSYLDGAQHLTSTERQIIGAGWIILGLLPTLSATLHTPRPLYSVLFSKYLSAHLEATPNLLWLFHWREYLVFLPDSANDLPCIHLSSASGCKGGSLRMRVNKD